MTQAQVITRATHGDSLADILERVLNTGLVIAGDIRVKLCDVELLSIQLRLLICSVEKARELGISWWWQTPEQPHLHGASGILLPHKTPSPEQPQRMDEANYAVPLEEYRRFREFQQFREVMRALEEGPR
jgi:hypothetical protein